MGSNLRRAKISKLELGPGVEDKQTDHPPIAGAILEHPMILRGTRIECMQGALYPPYFDSSFNCFSTGVCIYFVIFDKHVICVRKTCLSRYTIIPGNPRTEPGTGNRVSVNREPVGTGTGMNRNEPEPV